MSLLLFSGIIILLDQITKLAVKGFSIPFLGIEYDGMYLGQTTPVLGSFFRLTFVENKGIAFGIELNPIVKVLVSVVSLFACGFIIFYLKKLATKNRGAAFGLSLILGGAFGNMIDRIFYGAFYGYAPLFYGHVVDFFHVVFDVNIFGYYIDSFPIFNIADIAVSFGVGILFIFYGREEKVSNEVITESQSSEEPATDAPPATDNGQPVTDKETNVEDNNRKDL